MMFLGISLCILFTGLSYILRVDYRRRKFALSSWEEILTRLEPVNFDGLRSIAENYLQPDRNQLRFETGAMWDVVGGLNGIQRLRENARVMLDLAVFAERWNGEEGAITSEMIRRDALRLKRAALRIQLAYVSAHVFHLGMVRAPFHLQEAASSYYLIRGRLLSLYQVSHIALVPRLETAL